jgi:hypothetical protein
MTPTPTTAQVCAATKASGAPCRAYARAGRPFCAMHDPEHAEAMRVSRAAGGEATRRATPAPPIKLGTIAEQLTAIEETINRVRAAEEPLGVARLALYGISLARPLVELGELEERIKKLEEQHGTPE